MIHHSEAEIKKAVYAYLDAKKYIYVPILNAGVWNPKGFRQTFKGCKGAPDLILFDHNRKKWVCIELKSTKGKQSKEQNRLARLARYKADILAGRKLGTNTHKRAA